ncbi:MAG: L,D-transpeptidase [Nibricoccus sp.]
MSLMTPSSMIRYASAILLLLCSGLACSGADSKKKEAVNKSPAPKAAAEPQVSMPRIYTYPRPVENWLDVQVALARQAISCGSIDGVGGQQTAAGLRAFQERAGLEPTGKLDNVTRARLVLESHPTKQITLSAEDLESLQPLSKTWLGKSEQTALAFETALELAAERTHAHPNLLKRLNPDLDWSKITPTTRITVPDVDRDALPPRPALVQISLGEKTLQVRDEAGNLLAHFPVSIAKKAEKRPAGELHVTVVIANPDYTFDPDVFPESPEAQQLGRKLILPPGPNNPVGVAWIGLDLPGYGIHGTPSPEQVGRTESHGCFRLANWDAALLVQIAYVGLPVIVTE